MRLKPGQKHCTAPSTLALLYARWLGLSVFGLLTACTPALTCIQDGWSICTVLTGYAMRVSCLLSIRKFVGWSSLNVPPRGGFRGQASNMIGVLPCSNNAADGQTRSLVLQVLKQWQGYNTWAINGVMPKSKAGVWRPLFRHRLMPQAHGAGCWVSADLAVPIPGVRTTTTLALVNNDNGKVLLVERTPDSQRDQSAHLCHPMCDIGACTHGSVLVEQGWMCKHGKTVQTSQQISPALHEPLRSHGAM